MATGDEVARDRAETMAEMHRMPPTMVMKVRLDQVLRRIWPASTPAHATITSVKARKGETIR